MLARAAAASPTCPLAARRRDPQRKTENEGKQKQPAGSIEGSVERNVTINKVKNLAVRDAGLESSGTGRAGPLLGMRRDLWPGIRGEAWETGIGAPPAVSAFCRARQARRRGAGRGGDSEPLVAHFVPRNRGPARPGWRYASWRPTRPAPSPARCAARGNIP